MSIYPTKGSLFESFVVNIDVNKTIMAGDRAKGTTPFEDLRAMFAEYFKRDWFGKGTSCSCADFLRAVLSKRIQDQGKIAALVTNWNTTLAKLASSAHLGPPTLKPIQSSSQHLGPEQAAASPQPRKLSLPLLTDQIESFHQQMLQEYRDRKTQLQKEPRYEPWVQWIDTIRKEFVQTHREELEKLVSTKQSLGASQDLATQSLSNSSVESSGKDWKYWKSMLLDLLENNTNSEIEDQARKILDSYREFKKSKRSTMRNEQSLIPVLFPSFFDLIDYLDSLGRPFGIILRSFGDDLEAAGELTFEKMKTSLQHRNLARFKGVFTGAAFYIKEDPSSQPYLKITTKEIGEENLAAAHQGSSSTQWSREQEIKAKHAEEIGSARIIKVGESEFASRVLEICANPSATLKRLYSQSISLQEQKPSANSVWLILIQDSYPHWVCGRKQPSHGKPFILSDPEGRVFTIFLDDSANRVDPAKPMPQSSAIMPWKQGLTREEAQQQAYQVLFEEHGKRVIQVDTISAATDLIYLRRCVRDSINAKIDSDDSPQTHS